MDTLELVTTGDRWSAAGGGPAPTRGLFVKELEQALLDGRAHLAVHSAKDLPADLPEGLGVVAVPAREDPRDVVVGVAGGLDALAAGARVGTGSPRRSAQILQARPDLDVVPVRGNVGTRLERVGAEVDALVLAAAGLRRLGVERDDITPLDPGLCTPAPGQGLLAVEARLGGPAAEACAVLDDPVAHACLRAERRLLAVLGGGCMAPVGALATPAGRGRLELVAFAGSEDGATSARAAHVGSAGAPEDLADAVAERLGPVRT